VQEPATRPAPGGERPRDPAGLAAIELAGLRRDYGDRIALSGIDLRLERGFTLAVLGPNGAGKTTLLRVLGGLLRPSGGEVKVLGCSLPAETWRLRGRVGYLGHDPLLYRDLSSRENLAFAARLHGIKGDEGRRRVNELVRAVGLEHRADERIASLSAGMVQRVAACRAVLHQPELLLLDEPSIHLDADARRIVGSLLGPAPGRTRVLVSHDAEGARAESDRVLGLAADGSVVREPA
jgi:heme exporter protein A